jgi:ABC-2 type transport system ATP-binding protein
VAIIHAGRLAAIGTTAELKARFADRPILEVRSPDPVAAMAKLDSLPTVEKTSLFGTTVHAVLRQRTITPEEITAALVGAGIQVTSLSVVTPSLEDVFLDVVDRASSKGAAA